MFNSVEEQMKSLIELSSSTYKKRGERAALRCAMADSSALLDGLAKQIMNEHKGRGGKGATTKKGRELAEQVTKCANLIWEMRDQVKIK